MKKIIDGEDLRAVMRHVPSPVTVVTAVRGDAARGVTIGSFTSVSLNPPLISFNIEKAAQMHGFLHGATRFNVHVLANDQAHLSAHFALPDMTSEAQFEAVAYDLDAHGLPVLRDVLAVLTCTPYAFHEAGDHSLVLGHVHEVAVDDSKEPLLYFNRAYMSVGDAVKLRSLLTPMNRLSSESP